MLRLFSTKTYQDRVDDVYRKLAEDVGCRLELFEWRMRKIHVLNMKIRQRSADLGRKEEW